MRIGNAAENLSRVRWMTLMPLKQDTSAKIGIKAKRLKAGWDEAYLLKILQVWMRSPCKNEHYLLTSQEYRANIHSW